MPNTGCIDWTDFPLDSGRRLKPQYLYSLRNKLDAMHDGILTCSNDNTSHYTNDENTDNLHDYASHDITVDNNYYDTYLEGHYTTVDDTDQISYLSNHNDNDLATNNNSDLNTDNITHQDDYHTNHLDDHFSNFDQNRYINEYASHDSSVLGGVQSSVETTHNNDHKHIYEIGKNNLQKGTHFNSHDEVHRNTDEQNHFTNFNNVLHNTYQTTQ